MKNKDNHIKEEVGETKKGVKRIATRRHGLN